MKRLLAPLAFAAIVAIPATTHAAPMAGWVGTEADRIAPLVVPSAIPTWDTHGDTFPDCEANEAGALYDEFGVVFLDGSTARVGFTEAFIRNGDDFGGNNVWVVAGCLS